MDNNANLLNVRSIIKAYPENHGSLGRGIKISPKSHVTINKEGYEIKLFGKTVELLIGIGTDHVARLIMDIDAWEALKTMVPIDITTLKEFKEKFL